MIGKTFNSEYLYAWFFIDKDEFNLGFSAGVSEITYTRHFGLKIELGCIRFGFTVYLGGYDE